MWRVRDFLVSIADDPFKVRRAAGLGRRLLPAPDLFALCLYPLFPGAKDVARRTPSQDDEIATRQLAFGASPVVKGIESDSIEQKSSFMRRKSNLPEGRSLMVDRLIPCQHIHL
jgi:hypothetical protein